MRFALVAFCVLCVAAASAAFPFFRGSGSSSFGLSVVDVFPHGCTGNTVPCAAGSVFDNDVNGKVVVQLGCKLNDGSTGNCTYTTSGQPSFISVSPSGSVTKNTSATVADCTPSQDACTWQLVVSPVPPPPSVSVQCPSAPPAEAGQAGFGTMALCNDFTAAIPNTLGTGLPSNTGGNCFGGQGCWLGCPNPSGGAGDSFSHVWYSPEPDKWQAPPCNESGAGISQVTDPTFSNLALRVSYSISDQSSWGWQTMATVSAAMTNVSTQPTLFSDYPMAAFYQIVARDTGYLCQAPFGTGCDYATHEPNVDFFSWTAVGWNGQCYSGGTYICNPIEEDHVENWGNFANGVAIHNWPLGGNCNANPPQCNSVWTGTSTNFFDVTQYHTFGTLITSDGTSDIKSCGYIDHVFKGCISVPADAIHACGSQLDDAGSYCQRNALAVWSDSFNNYPIGTGTLPIQVDYYIKSIQVWSCADWPRGSAGPNPHCFGGPSLTTNSDGSVTYTVTTQ